MKFTRINATTKSNKAEALKNEEFNSKNMKVIYVTVCGLVFYIIYYMHCCDHIQCCAIVLCNTI